MTTALVFPHQLFENNPLAESVDQFYLIEDELYFRQYNFHKAKLLLHRASMKYYELFLKAKGKQVIYIEIDNSSLDLVFKKLKAQENTAVQLIDPTDYLLKSRINRYSAKYNIKVELHENPSFLTSVEQLEKDLQKKKSGYLMANFYQSQRKRLDLLIDNGQPEGGQWSFDEDNRKKLPKNIELPRVKQLASTEFVAEAKKYIASNFEQNLGECQDFNYPITHEQAKEALDNFLLTRMPLFGDYEDAIAKKETFLFHSVLTPALNIGLLTPSQVIGRTMELHEKHHFPLNCLEGFIRQVIGWREFMRGIYEFEGVFERTNNHFNHRRKIPASFYDGTTGIVPIDITIKKILKTGYCHHIERLMLLGNFMLLCEFDPDEIYRWFMELFIDAYDWVMVPNVYGMTQYADGGLITTKPYISSSNYVLKMSDYKKDDWCKVWDGLYWRFVDKHQVEFSQNHRMGFVTNLLKRIKPETLEAHLKNADRFLESLELDQPLKELSLFES